MDLWEAVLLGILQGLTEFLPVSSTAHVTIAGHALGLIDSAHPERWTAFLAVIQLGTLAAVVWYFRRDLLAMLRGDHEARRIGWLVVLATIPIGIVGLLTRDIIEGPLTKDLRIIAFTLIALGLLMGAADRWGRSERDMTAIGWRQALIVGAAQVLSLIPGASRAGSTITGGLFAGLTREAAARFSFLMSIPAIAAAGVFQLPAAVRVGTDDIIALIVATLAAAVSGYLAVAWMLRYLRTRSTAVFVVYRVALGAGIVGALAAGWI